MPFITPTFDDIRSDILRDIKNLNTDADIGVDSDLYIRASAVASVATGIYQYQGWIVRQIFPDTADTEFLEWHAHTRLVSQVGHHGQRPLTSPANPARRQRPATV
jgi:uncharacterized phage protein gp47/JayE